MWIKAKSKAKLKPKLKIKVFWKDVLLDIKLLIYIIYFFRENCIIQEESRKQWSARRILWKVQSSRVLNFTCIGWYTHKMVFRGYEFSQLNWSKFFRKYKHCRSDLKMKLLAIEWKLITCWKKPTKRHTKVIQNFILTAGLT